MTRPTSKTGAPFPEARSSTWSSSPSSESNRHSTASCMQSPASPPSTQMRAWKTSTIREPSILSPRPESNALSLNPGHKPQRFAHMGLPVIPRVSSIKLFVGMRNPLLMQRGVQLPIRLQQRVFPSAVKPDWRQRRTIRRCPVQDAHVLRAGSLIFFERLVHEPPQLLNARYRGMRRDAFHSLRILHPQPKRPKPTHRESGKVEPL